MKNKFTLKKILTSAALIILSAATVSCGQYKPSNNDPNNNGTVQEQTPNIYNYKDGVYSLISNGNDTYKAVNYFAVLNSFNADGKTDDSQNLQALLDKAAKKGGTVYIPKGIYKLEAPIVIPENVTLTGDFDSPRSSTGTQNCTVFIVGENEKTLSTPLFTLNDGSAITEISVYYEGQTYGDVKDYPYTIEHDAGKTAEISNITIFNAANGINLSSPDAQNVTVSDIYMTAVKNGIYALFCAEKLEITNIFIDPSLWFNCDLDNVSQTVNAEILTDKIKNDLIGISISATADAYIDNVRINTCNSGIKIDIPDITNNTPLFSDLTVNDAARSALVLINAPKTGIAFAKCSFRTDDGYGSKDVEVTSDYTAPTVFNSCSFRGSPSYSVYSEGRSMLSFVGCDFISWKETAISSTDKIVSVSGGSFNRSGDLADIPPISVGLFALNDMYAGYSPEEITVFIAETNNEYTVNRITDTWFENLTSEFNIGGKIYNASDYGVSQTEQNNSRALQMAIYNAHKNGGGTVFVNEGTYVFKNDILLHEGVRLQGVGNGKTVFKFQAYESGNFLTLKGKNKIDGISFEYIGTETPEEALENPIKAIYSEASDIKISNVEFKNTHYAIYLSDASNITIKNLTGSTVIGGIYAELCDFMNLNNIEFTKHGLSEEVITHQHEKYVAVMIRECTGTLCENLSSDNGDYLIYLNSENVDVVPEEPTAAIKGLFAENVYSAFAINRYDFAAVVNVSADTAIYGKNAYHATTFAGNRGNLCVYNMIGKGDVTGGMYLRGGTVSIQSCIFNTCGTTAVKNEGSTAEVIGCIIMDKNLNYHAESATGSMAFIANIINSDKEFTGADASYIRSYTAPEAAFTEEYNLIPIPEDMGAAE